MSKRTQASESDILKIGRVLNDTARPLKERFRALFTLRNVGGATAIEQIHACFKDQSALLKHELAYCLGQMRDPAAIKILTGVLEDLKQEPIVRHEAGEALGAIGDPSVIPLLKKYRDDPSPEVAETCELALDRINWLRCNKRRDFPNKYSTVDPAPPMDRLEVIERMREMESTGKMEKTRKQMGKMKVITNDVCFLKTILLDENDSLFNRYKAMFLLRDMDTQKSVQALTKGLKAGSALLRHEVAFVLGQLQNKSTISALRASLENTEEHEMVRHECAEALGAIATPECYAILKKYLDDDKRVVLESCIVALDMCDYENSTEFQYADTLANLATA